MKGIQSSPRQKSWDQTAVFARKQGIYLLFVFSQVFVCLPAETDGGTLEVCLYSGDLLPN